MRIFMGNANCFTIAFLQSTKGMKSRTSNKRNNEQKKLFGIHITTRGANTSLAISSKYCHCEMAKLWVLWRTLTMTAVVLCTVF